MQRVIFVLTRKGEVARATARDGGGKAAFSKHRVTPSVSLTADSSPSRGSTSRFCCMEI